VRYGQPCKRTTEPVSHRPQRAYAVAHLPGAVPGGRDPRGHYALGFGLFATAGLTDALDGLLARVLKQRSVLGEYLDPVADKLLLSTLFLVLLHKGLMPTTVTVLVFGRDVGILVVAAILTRRRAGREFNPSLLGKANTLAQVSAVAAVLLHQLTTAQWVVAFRMVALDATIGLTVASDCIMPGSRPGGWAPTATSQSKRACSHASQDSPHSGKPYPPSL